MKDYGVCPVCVVLAFETLIYSIFICPGRRVLTSFERRFLRRHSNSLDLDHSRSIIFILVQKFIVYSFVFPPF